LIDGGIGLCVWVADCALTGRFPHLLLDTRKQLGYPLWVNNLHAKKNPDHWSANSYGV